MVCSRQQPCLARPCVWRADRVTGVPARPAAYLRGDSSSDMTRLRDMVIGLVQSLGWPVPTVYADVGPPGPPGSQLAALVEAISAGGHDAVFATHPMVIAGDLDQIEAFDLLCRQHGVRLRFRWSGQARDPRALFDVIRGVKRFTVTDEHLRLLRRAYVGWDETEFGAPGINAKRPYGNSDVYGDIAEILGLVDGEWQDEVQEDWPPPELEWRFLRLHVETAIALQIALATGEFRAGPYVCENGHNAWNATRRKSLGRDKDQVRPTCQGSREARHQSQARRATTAASGLGARPLPVYEESCSARAQSRADGAVIFRETTRTTEILMFIAFPQWPAGRAASGFCPGWSSLPPPCSPGCSPR
jgi:hypothetical protein